MSPFSIIINKPCVTLTNLQSISVVVDVVQRILRSTIHNISCTQLVKIVTDLCRKSLIARRDMQHIISFIHIHFDE